MEKTISVSWRLLLVALVLSAKAQTSETESSFMAAVKKDTAWLAGYASRVVGTAGHEEASRELLEKIRTVPNVRVWTHEFPVIVPVVEKAELTVSAGPMQGTHRIYPVWPDLVRLKTTPAAGITGRLIYIGTGTIPEVPARSLRGNIAVLEMSHYENWKNAFTMGAEAMILLGGKDDQYLPPSQQPLYKPRYYVPEGTLADALRKGDVKEGTLFCRARWVTTTAVNIYALVKPERSAGNPPALAIGVPYDSMSVVMGLAPGADVAVDTAFILNILRRYAGNPPSRPLFFGFVDAYGINQMGVRHMLAMLSVTPDQETRNEYEKLDGKDFDEYRQAAQLMEQLGTGREALEQLYKNKYKILRGYFKDEIGPEIVRLKEDLGNLRLKVMTAEGEEKAAIQQKIDRMLKRQNILNKVLSQVLGKKPLDDNVVVPIALDAWKIVHERVRTQLAEVEGQIGFFKPLDTMRNSILNELGIEGENRVPVDFLFSVDLSDAGVAVGPALSCSYLLTTETMNARAFVRWLKTCLTASENPVWNNDQERAVNMEAVLGTDPGRSFVTGYQSLFTSPARSFLVPAVTWATLDGRCLRVDTPQDRVERLDWTRLTPQIEATVALVDRLVSDPKFDPKIKTSSPAEWRHARGTVVGVSLGETVPRVPMVGFLTALAGVSMSATDESGGAAGVSGVPGIRRHEYTLTGRDGRFRFVILAGQTDSSQWSSGITNLRVESFKMDDTGRIVRGLTKTTSLVSGRVSSVVDLNENPSASPARVVVFDCVELSGPVFFDPRFLEPLSQYTLFDVTRGGAPKKVNFSIHSGQMFGLVESRMKWQLILRAGATRNRMILMNVDPKSLEKGLTLRGALRQGFNVDEKLWSVPEHIAARDFFLIDDRRIKDFRQAGITSKAINEIHERTGKLLGEADKALGSDDGAALCRAAASALANEIRAYQAVLDSGDDVTRGAIFLMLLILPFSLAMERLVFACAHVGRQIIATLAIFVVMTAILWSFHPAFRITAQPMIIIMAFAILALSLMVTVMIIRKFEADLEHIRSGRAEASGAKTSRGGVITSAVWLGIANMRKHKVRTALTSTTIVLITFALLCFSSTSSYQDKRQFKLKDVSAPYPGVLIQQPDMQPMDQYAVPAVNNLLAGKFQLGTRYWKVSDSAEWKIHVRNPKTGKQISLRGGLGLPPNENELSGTDRILKHWNEFAENGGCFLAKTMAEKLGVEPGDTVVVGGEEMKFLDAYDPSRIEKELLMLHGQSLLPFDYSVKAGTHYTSRTQEAKTAQMSGGVGLEPDRAVVHMAADDIIILPAEFTRRIGGSLQSIAFRTASGEDAKKTALELMEKLAFPIYYGSGDDVNVIVATPLFPKVPRSLLIPLLIASLIIFNTMLNSVAERKSEIHIYTSLGLAPSHVGILFLAEAVTYGLMGSIFGYVVGQGMATVLGHLGWMGGITLNYSGTHVIMTMGLILIVVILSAIVPAIMAGKIATPSKEMNWKVPQPKNEVIHDVLPFTVSAKTAKGVIAFIHEYMDAHREGSIGCFTIADDLRVLGMEGCSLAGLEGTVWLAPYDLGVRQKVKITVCPEKKEKDICDLVIELSYGSGQEKTWWRLNKVFLGDVRRQLLGWRNIKPERMVQYIMEAEKGA